MRQFDEKLSKYLLRKITNFWGLRTKAIPDNENQESGMVKEDEGESDNNESKQGKFYVYYMFAPPWARHAKPVLYLQQL